jgi:hypothetical protein
MKLGMCIIPLEGISTAYTINPFDEKYKYYRFPNFCGNNLNITYMPKPTFMELGTYIIQPEPISTVHFTNPSIIVIQLAEAKP